jgi:hypothetical protein
MVSIVFLVVHSHCLLLVVTVDIALHVHPNIAALVLQYFAVQWFDFSCSKKDILVVHDSNPPGVMITPLFQ